MNVAMRAPRTARQRRRARRAPEEDPLPTIATTVPSAGPGPMRLAAPPRTTPSAMPAPLASVAALRTDELRRALDLELRLAAVLPPIVLGAHGRGVRLEALAMLAGAERRVVALRTALVECDVLAPVRRPSHAAQALADELAEAQWEADGAASDGAIALALHRLAAHAAATWRGVRALLRDGGTLATGRLALDAARAHEGHATRWLGIAAGDASGESAEAAPAASGHAA